MSRTNLTCQGEFYSTVWLRSSEHASDNDWERHPSVCSIYNDGCKSNAGKEKVVWKIPVRPCMFGGSSKKRRIKSKHRKQPGTKIVENRKYAWKRKVHRKNRISRELVLNHLRKQITRQFTWTDSQQQAAIRIKTTGWNFNIIKRYFESWQRLSGRVLIFTFRLTDVFCFLFFDGTYISAMF